MSRMISGFFHEKNQKKNNRKRTRRKQPFPAFPCYDEKTNGVTV
jgi:hypothetical protein